MTVALWGTFSVVDHLRSHPFIADVLLYDRPAVPVPSDEIEAKRWAERNRQLELQAGLLEILGKHRGPRPLVTRDARSMGRDV